MEDPSYKGLNTNNDNVSSKHRMKETLSRVKHFLLRKAKEHHSSVNAAYHAHYGIGIYC